MSNADALAAITYERIQTLLTLEYVEEHFLQYQAGGDNDEWIRLDDLQGERTDVYVEFRPQRIRIALENLTSAAADNGFSDNRHFVFKLLDADTQAVELLFQPIEVNALGEDQLDTFPLSEQTAATQHEAAHYFTELESYLQARDADLTQIKDNLPPDMILNVLGTFDSFDTLKTEFETLATSMGCETFRLDTEFSELENDDRMPSSYSACMDRTEPSMTDEDWQHIEDHTASAYFIVKRIYSERTRIPTAMATARGIGHLIDKQLITAAKIETAGLAHGLERWKALADELSAAIEKRDQRNLLVTLYKMFVRKPIQDENKLYTCGMQNLGLPDLVLVFDRDEGPSDDEQLASVERFENAFLAMVGVEQGSEEVKPYPGRPSFGYGVGDIRYNPFGFHQVG